MVGIAEIIFWISLFILVYTYAGYPLLLFISSKLKKIFWRPKDHDLQNTGNLPELTVLVSAFNEENIIAEKIHNTTSLNYPAELIRIVFVTDGSTDKTPQIVAADARITLLHEADRRGKLHAQNRAMKSIATDIVVFSDANTGLNSDALVKIARHFVNPRIGGVSGEKKVIADEDAVSRGEGLYWKYESFLKKMDSDVFTMVGAAGELFAMRKSLYTYLPENVIIEDFVQSLLLCKKGYRVKYEPQAWSMERGSVSVKDEMERKIRISAGGFQAMAMLKSLFNVFKRPVLSFQFISHRVLRWTLCPLALITLLLSSVVISTFSNSVFFRAMTVLQLLFYLAATIGWTQSVNNKRSAFFYLPFYFTFMHCCVFAGFSRYLRGEQGPVWNKAQRGKKT